MEELERCPYCDGRGVRVVAPAPLKRGGPKGTKTGRRHGYSSTYASGCRCELCRAAWRELGRRRRAQARESAA